MQDVSRAFSIVPADKSVLSLLEKIRLQVIAAGVDASQIKKEMPEAAKMWVFALSRRIARVGAWPRFVVAKVKCSCGEASETPYADREPSAASPGEWPKPSPSEHPADVCILETAGSRLSPRAEAHGSSLAR